MNNKLQNLSGNGKVIAEELSSQDLDMTIYRMIGEIGARFLNI